MNKQMLNKAGKMIKNGETDVKKIVEGMKEEATGMVYWTNVRGQKFTNAEAAEAADFEDTMNSYCVASEDVGEFISENVNLGVRLYISNRAPTDQLGALLLGEDDRRVVAICKERCSEFIRKADGRSNILMPWE